MKTPKFECAKCKKETPIQNTTGPTYCEDCCTDHCYEYEREERKHYCINCGAEPPYDWHGYYGNDF